MRKPDKLKFKRRKSLLYETFQFYFETAPIFQHYLVGIFMEKKSYTQKLVATFRVAYT